MTPKQEAALRLALDALKGGLWDYGPGQDEHERCNEVIAICEEALAEQQVIEHAPCQGMNCGITRTYQEHSMECQAEHAAAIAGGQFVKTAQQQEPVAYSYTSRITGAQGFSHHPMPRFTDADSWDIKPLYTSPPASKPWVGLTEAEFNQIMVDTYNIDLTVPGHASDDYLLWKAIEAKLREKNA